MSFRRINKRRDVIAFQLSKQGLVLVPYRNMEVFVLWMKTVVGHDFL